ncbi:eclosion hormone-like protein [Tribolium castaneum]|uniref:Eclosion hormone-like protein n=1 Tax=Tribolium castaneum TaxID=7070 RepID=D6WCM0_TRICA|nr:PREDICTED: eclosion hormone isoform X2 [Tribolium castaneum]EEZ99174.1 eclosion hormone-like protein [Tribolium castaneum]|eukprot:XP_008190384.1 PREDICTED: eclosion hormone isoform X2 [Tribolium castaneum]
MLKLLFILLAVDTFFSNASIPVCITNCVQCKQMFGPYFQGRACGDACVSTNGRLVPDCNNAGTLGNFLKRLY